MDTSGSTRISVSRFIARAFAEEGVEVIFGVMGDANLAFVAELVEAGIRLYQTRHEAAAVAMADGFSRVSGKTAAAVVTCGPGLTHAATSIGVAARHGSRLVVFAGDSPLSYHELGGIQEMDQRAIVEACGARFAAVRSPKTVAEDVQACFAAARCGPVVLNVVADAQGLPVPDGSYAASAAIALDPSPSTLPDPADVATVAADLASARRPVIVEAKGISSQEHGSLVNLGHRIGALFATTLDSMGAFDDEDWCLGVIAPFAHTEPQRLLDEADVVVVCGSGADRFPTVVGTNFPNAKVIAIGDASRRVSRQRIAERHVGGGLVPALEALNRAIPNQATGYRTNEVRARLTPDPREQELAEFPADQEFGRVDPRAAMLVLDRLLPVDTTIVVGAAHFWSFPNMFLRSRGGRKFHHTHDFGAIGQAMPTAIGAAIANNGRPTVAVEGDGGIMQHLQELDTAARYDVPLLTIVIDDDGLGAEYHKLRARGQPADEALIATPAIDQVAVGLGLYGVTARTLDAIEVAITRWVDHPTPMLLDIRTARQVVSPMYRRVHFGLLESPRSPTGDSGLSD